MTPLQMARFYALIANGGKLVTPHVLLGIERPSGGAIPHPRPSSPQSTGVDPQALDVVRQGLLEATHSSFGTSTAVFGSFPVAIAGKTGTAEKVVDVGNGFHPLYDQAWWCGYGPANSPKLVVCAVIENGGHGGVAAAPAALEVFQQYFNKQTSIQSASHSD